MFVSEQNSDSLLIVYLMYSEFKDVYWLQGDAKRSRKPIELSGIAKERSIEGVEFMEII